jgi:m7GpppX diphosphatase
LPNSLRPTAKSSTMTEASTEASRSLEKLLTFNNAIVLSVSDNHATVLLRSSTTDGGSVRSLLKMTVVPTYRNELASSTKKFAGVEELESAPVDESSSQGILDFLKNFDFSLTSESGAEYSYYTATEKMWWQKNLVFSSLLAPPKEAFKVELISPASDRQIQRSLPAPAMSLVEETPEIYESIVKPHVDRLIEGGSLSWIQNVVNGMKEVERLLLNKDDFILNVDTKWKSHPDAKTTPREEWLGHKAVDDLYCLAIVKDGSVTSLRDLRGRHIPMLGAILKQGREAIEGIYGVRSDQLRIFVHYQPQFYHFHVHFTRLENELGCQVERGHLLSDIIQNLEMDSDYYAKRTISYKLETSSELFSLLQKRRQLASCTIDLAESIH